MNHQDMTNHTEQMPSYGYALRMFIGWSILYMGSLIGFIHLIRSNLI